jgi:hypothetical protein
MKDNLLQKYHRPGSHGIKKLKSIHRELQRDLRLDPESKPIHRSELRHSYRYRCQSRATVWRYLEAQVGKSWDEIYSQIRHAKGSGLLEKEFLDEVKRLVEQHVVLIDGEPYDSTGLEITASCSPVWVHPLTNILMASPNVPLTRRSEPEKRFCQVFIDQTHRLVMLNDSWFEVTYAPLPNNEQVERDILLNEPTSKKRVSFITAEWGADIYAVSKRQANKREIKRFVT